MHSGSSDAVWALLEEKADPNMKIKGRGSLLEEAVSMGRSMGRFHKEIVRDLVSAEAEADVSPKGNGVHIMHRAAMFGLIEMVEYCLKRHCKIDMVTTEGPEYPRRFEEFPTEMTPLAYACAEGHVEVVDLLLDHGAPFEQDRPHSAVLWTAAYQGHAEVCDLLLRRFEESHGPEETARFLLQRPHPESGHPILYAAASSGKADVVQTLLDHGAKYEGNWMNATPLYASAIFSSPEVTKVLLDYHRRGQIDVCLNQQGNRGKTALYEACRKGLPVIGEMLLEAGADYLITDKDNTTPLQVGCYHGRFRLVSAVVEKASRELERTEFLKFLNTQHRPTGNVALIDCAEKNRPACLDLLLDRGADYAIPGNDNFSILQAATRHDNSSIMAAIVNRAAKDLDRKGLLDFLNIRHERSGRTALVDATERNRLGAVNILLANGADYTIPGYAGNTPLHWACIGGHEEVLRTLLNHAKSNKPDPTSFLKYINRGNKQDDTPLMQASERNHLSVVKTLFGYGADYTASHVNGGLHGVTALHKACFNGSREVVTCLLERASQELEKERFAEFVNARNGLGKTALHDACQTGRPRISKLLLETYYADYSTADQDDVTPLHAAVSGRHVEAVEALLKTGSADKDHHRFNSFVNHKSRWQMTALMVAAKLGFPKILASLLAHGANYTLADGDSFTALHYSAFRQRTDCVRILLETASADPQSARFRAFLDQQGRKNGASALHDAIKPDRGYAEVAKLILKYEPAYDTLDDRQRTPLHRAVATGNTDIAKLLLELAGKDPDRERFRRFVNARDCNDDTAWKCATRRNQGAVVDALTVTGVLERQD